MITIDERDDVKVPTPDANQVTLFYTDQALRFKDESGDVYTLVKQSDLDAIEEAKPKVYRALLTQSGTNAPVAIVLENTLGGTVVWTYSDVGTYFGTLVGAFTNNKTVGVGGDVVHFHRINIYNSLTGNENRGFFIRKQDEDILELFTFSAADVTANDILAGNYIEILVYP